MSRISSLIRWLFPAGLLILGSVAYGQTPSPTPIPDAELEACPPDASVLNGGGIVDGDYGLANGDYGVPNGDYGFGSGRAYVLSCRELDYNRPDLFYNFYVPNQCGSLPAALYLCPRPVPPLVGHTYYTYQPFLPHEFLYEHKRTYYRYYNDGRGLNRTKVSWTVAPTTHIHNAWHWMRIPR